MPAKPRIAIIGAGPIGLEAALYARLKDYDVSLYEYGEIAENIRKWGHVKMFSPFGMNSSHWGRQALSNEGQSFPEAEEILTGQQFYQRYLRPLSELTLVKCTLNERWSVAGVARRGVLKGELIGDPGRGRYPFVLRGGSRHRAWSAESEIVLDCSGTFGRSRGWGLGGVIPPFEGVCCAIPDFSTATAYAGDHTLVIGSGYSAATNVVNLARLVEAHPGTQITWVTRHKAAVPIRRLSHDRLPERDALARQANRLATESRTPVDWRPGFSVRTCDRSSKTKKYAIELDDTQTGETQPPIRCDHVIANCGYRPDRSLYEELQVHECYATQGPMKLAAQLLSETSTDCLDQTSHGPEVLRNPEPNFYILGMKSYGRNSNFLIQVGLQQIVDVFSLIEQDWGL